MNIGLNNLLQAKALLTRTSFNQTLAVLERIAPQLAIQLAHLAVEALFNMMGKLRVLDVISSTKWDLELDEKLELQNRTIKPITVDSIDADPSRDWGSLGDIEFDLLSAPTGFSSKEGVVYAQHAVIGEKPRLQFTGAKLEEPKLEISWYDITTSDIQGRFEALLEAMRERVVLELVIGKSTVGSIYAGKYVIRDISHKVIKYNVDRSIKAIDLTVDLLEWVETPELVTTSKTPPPGVNDPKNASQKANTNQGTVEKDQRGNVLGPDGKPIGKK